MANTTKISGNFIQITGLDADWLFSDNPETIDGFKCKSIQFIASAANDIMVINNDSIDGASIFHEKASADTIQKIKYFTPPTFIRPVIDITDCTLGTAANAKVIIEMA